MLTYQKIKSAIKNKQVISATYKQTRVKMCPYILGTKDGDYHSLFYILDDTTSDDNWHCIPIEELENVEIVSVSWQNALIPSNPVPYFDIVDEMVNFNLDI